MSRPTVLHICLAFCSLLFLNFATKCLAFPKLERREIAQAYAGKGQSEKMDTGDQEHSSTAPEHKPQQMSSEDPMVLSAGPSVTPLNKEISINEESHLIGAGLLHPDSPGPHSATEPVVLARQEVYGSSQLERMSPEHRLSKAMLTIAATATTSLNSDQEGPFSSSSIQPLVEEIREATQGFLKYTDNQLFATESQEGVSLGQSPSSYINTKELLTASPRTEKAEAHEAQRTTSFPGVVSTAHTEPDGKKPSQTTAVNVQATATKHLLATSEYVLSVEPETDSLLGAPKVTVSVSTAVPVASVLGDEWDDTKLESISQIRPPELGDNAETQVRAEPSQTTYVSSEGTKGDPTSTEAAEVPPALPEGETHVGTALLIAPEDQRTLDERSSVFTGLTFTPSSLTEDTEVSVVNQFPTTGDSTDSIKDSLFSETTISLSQYESETYQPVGHVFKDITQEMTTATLKPDTALPLVTQEQVAAIEVPRDCVEPEEGKMSPSSVSDPVGTTQLSRIWESVATPASTTAVPLSPEVTSAEDLLDTITGPNEEFIAVLGSPVTSSAVTLEAPTIGPVLPSEGSTAPSIGHTNTAASYGPEQLESEEEEDEDEEDEEDEDEEEEDEEEDEEDKDADSLIENFDGDPELPGFTVPDITSQEPDIEPGSLDLLERATYQVPDAIEWEQQNQGLVRSWMEKLKDKAGYMSGMLVPVGVGIAGALFILGALYSIKVMNRRRRNGFKRHKRKQREFNSMQDRVMLLADSSEDEF